MNQPPLPLPHRVARGRFDFLAAPCNAAALGWIERWPEWPEAALVLHGPPGSGKSHLAELWRARSGGALVAGGELGDSDPAGLAGRRTVAVDDAEAAPERSLLHLYNCCLESGTSLLIVAQRSPVAWPFGLPDLASRLRAAPSVAIGAPDDVLLAAVLIKQFTDRQLRPPPEIIAFLVRRMERSFAAAAALAERIDRLSLGSQRPLTLPLARRALAGEAP